MSGGEAEAVARALSGVPLLHFRQLYLKALDFENQEAQNFLGLPGSAADGRLYAFMLIPR